jgi:ABC-type multidrug transport system ATPase subunit
MNADQYCKLDRDAFVVDTRAVALVISLVFIAVGFATVFFYFKSKMKLIKSDNQIVDGIKFSAQERHVGVGTAKAFITNSGKKETRSKQIFPFRKEDNCISALNLHYFPSVESSYPILKNIELNIKYGSFVALMGGSGGGKTTLLDVLSGRRTQGDIQGEGSILGHDLTTLTASNLGDIAYMRQFESYPDSMTVQGFLFYRASLRGFDEVEAMKRAKYCIEKVKIESFAGRKISALSGGQKRRLGVAQLLICMPKVLFLDEPTSGLDALSSFEVINALRGLVENGDGLTVIVTIHQPRIELFKLFTDVVVLCQGRIAVHADNYDSYSVYTKLCHNLGFLPKREKNIGNPADAVIDALAKVTPWVKIRMWISDELGQKGYLRDRLQAIVMSSKNEEHHSNKIVFLSRRSNSNIIQTNQGKSYEVIHGVSDKTHQMKLTSWQVVEKLFPVWSFNAPIESRNVYTAFMICVWGQYFLLYVLMDPCSLPILIIYSSIAFVCNSYLVNSIVVNYAQSLYDNDNMLKEKIIGPIPFAAFHGIIYAFWCFTVTGVVWLLGLPVYLSMNIPLENTLLVWGSRFLTTCTHTALALCFVSNIEDPSSTSQVAETSAFMQVIMAAFTAFNGVCITYNLMWKANWVFWLSSEFPAGIVMVQSLLEGQKASCTEDMCAEHNATILVSLLELEEFVNTWLPFVISIGWLIMMCICYVIIIIRRCNTTLPGRRIELENIRLVAKATVKTEDNYKVNNKVFPEEEAALTQNQPL